MDWMKPIAREDIPMGDEWVYEIKFDGFRSMLHWQRSGVITLTTKNNHDVTAKFPEIIEACKKHQSLIKPFLPIKLDGELVVLNYGTQANFSWIQKRGRMKNDDNIQKAAKDRPTTFLAFDLLEINGTALLQHTFIERKASLKKLFLKIDHPSLKLVETYEDAEEIKKIVFDGKGEGIVAKRKKSKYVRGKGHQDWFKIKNWRTLYGFLTAYQPENGYFTISVFNGKHVKTLGSCKHGLDTETYTTVKQMFLQNGMKKGNVYYLPPAICAQVQTLDLYEGELREPNFRAILPGISPEELTYSKALLDAAMIPEDIGTINESKVFWPRKNFKKEDLLIYLREISPYMLPFLKNRLLTVIRCPDGIEGESFFQKHLPDYAPDFMEGAASGDERRMLCNNLKTLLWLGNHGAVEYHVPFEHIRKSCPSEIVFDLDPPSREQFPVAIFASQLIKQIVDDLQLESFVKTSGNKGIQVHIPIPLGSMSYEDTGIFTQSIAWTLEQTYPDLFTTERMKKKRKGRLYIDYVQHGEGKTMIAPYSPRKTMEGTVATPLFWEEVTEKLRPEQFTIANVVERVQLLGCPFRTFFDVQNRQKMDKLLNFIR